MLVLVLFFLQQAMFYFLCDRQQNAHFINISFLNENQHKKNRSTTTNMIRRLVIQTEAKTPHIITCAAHNAIDIVQMTVRGFSKKAFVSESRPCLCIWIIAEGNSPMRLPLNWHIFQASGETQRVWGNAVIGACDADGQDIDLPEDVTCENWASFFFTPENKKCISEEQPRQ